MTGAEAAKRAEVLLDRSTQVDLTPVTRATLIARADVFATLALALATAGRWTRND